MASISAIVIVVLAAVLFQVYREWSFAREGRQLQRQLVQVGGGDQDVGIGGLRVLRRGGNDVHGQDTQGGGGG